MTDRGKLKEAPPWMWGIAVLGLSLVLGSIAFTLYEAAAGDSSPPDVTLRVDSVSPTRSGFLVEFRAVNEGGSTAEGLTVEGELRSGAESVETSDTTIEYVPPHSERKGGLFFTSASSPPTRGNTSCGSARRASSSLRCRAVRTAHMPPGHKTFARARPMLQ